MIPPQMLMDTSAAHAEQLRLMGIPSPSRPARSRRSRNRPAGNHRVRTATGRVLVQLGTALMRPAPRETACAN